MSKIKILHTSDWHLGKRLYRKDREAEHLRFLNWIEKTLEEKKITVLLLAGDVFDSPTPPHSSLKIYYDFLKRVSDLGVTSVIISGNHDSQGLIDAPQELLKEKKIILASKLSMDPCDNVFRIPCGNSELWVKSLPYFRNYELIRYAQERNLFNEQVPREEVFQAALKDFFKTWPQGTPAGKILLSHHVFGNYSPTGSEHFIGLTGIETIPMEFLRGEIDYAALGHIHKYQRLSEDPHAFYTGSPIQMRFSENKNKYVNILEIKEGAPIQIEKLRIPVSRELIQVKTDSENFIEDVKRKLEEHEGDLCPFVEIQMDMKEAKTGLVDVLKTLCEEAGAELLSFIPNISAANYEAKEKVDLSELNIMELFKKFYKEKFPEQEEAPSYMLSNFKQLMEESSSEDS